jgi:putative transposase
MGKVVETGSRLVLVDATYPSQECRRCRAIVPKPPSLRRHVWQCEADEHQDLNAAGVILS